MALSVKSSFRYNVGHTGVGQSRGKKTEKRNSGKVECPGIRKE